MNNIPTFTPIQPTYKKTESEVWVINFDDIPVPADLVHDQQIVHLAPGSVGGNHRHPRVEWFVAVGELVFHWLDEAGQLHSEQMNPDGELRLIMVPSLVPHAVENTSATERGVLFELADGKMEQVEKVKVV